MNADLWWQNLIAWWLQALAVVAAGAAVEALFRLRDPRARLGFRQVLLLACLALPWVQPWRQPTPIRLVATGRAELLASYTPAEPSGLPFLELALALLAAGVVARAAWIALGLWRLRRYRRQARPFDPLPEPVQWAARQAGAAARFCLSDRISGPVTFGFRRPMVLVPERFLELSPPAQQAIACHELVHVRRRDWAFTVAEECVRALLWFHPAIWWLLGRIHLAREQVVDREVVEITGSRPDYLRALMAMAAARVEPDLAPAPLFLRRRHLVRRVASLLEEVGMSKRRVAGALAGALVLVVAAGGLAARAFPLQAAPAEENGVALRNTGGTLLHRAPLEYPREARRKGISGAVVLELSVNEEGEVTDARVLSGPEELRRAALRSVLEWHYSKEMPLPAKLQVTIDFQLGPAPPRPDAAALRAGPVSRDLGPLKRIDLGSLAAPLQEALRARLPVREGDLMTAAAQERVRQAVGEVDEHLVTRLSTGADGVALQIVLGAPQPPARIRVGGNVQATQLVQSRRPVYPPEAKQERIQGTVQLEATIGRDGRVVGLTVLNGHPLLVPAAVEAVQEWVYKPTLLNGNPVEVLTQIDINFTLRP
jgi:TonB family protein